MKLAGAGTLIYGLTSIMAGAVGFWISSFSVSSVIGVILGVALLLAAREILKGRSAAAFVACGVAMLQGVFFGYRFIATGSFFPGGIMLVVSFATLFVILIGVFLSLMAKERQR